MLGFASDPGLANLARIDPDQPGSAIILDVDSGRTIRSLPLQLGEIIADLEPLARKLLILQRPTKVGFQFRAFAFADLATEAPIGRIQSGGGETVDSITRLALPPKVLAEILGEGPPANDK